MTRSLWHHNYIKNKNSHNAAISSHITQITIPMLNRHMQEKRWCTSQRFNQLDGHGINTITSLAMEDTVPETEQQKQTNNPRR